ncbi:MAG TPA: PPOX class F420-dependent oxidoreductase [Micromonosporaceae bacterium]
MASTLDTVGNASYALVTTYRKDGRAVPTPTWVVRDGEALAIWTISDSGKVKRIRRSSQVLIGPCDARGRPTGEQVPARAAILDQAGTEHVRDLLRRKYGLLGRITLAASRWRRGLDGTLAIRITPA